MSEINAVHAKGMDMAEQAGAIIHGCTGICCGLQHGQWKHDDKYRRR